MDSNHTVTQQEFTRLVAGAQLWAEHCVQQFHELTRAFAKLGEAVNEWAQHLREQDNRRKELRRLAKERIHGR